MGRAFNNNLKKSINISKKISLDKFIFSIGIRHIGQENAKYSGFFKSIDEFKKFIHSKNKNQSLTSLLQIDGIGDTQINSIKSFFSNETNVRIVENLIKVLDIKEYEIKSQDGIFSNKTIMFTGGFKEMSRSKQNLLQKIMEEKS